MAGIITQEMLVKMLRAMDVSGDGIVSEDEFMVVYMKLHPESLPSEYKALWTKIDQNQDGTLQPEELAAYFGFDFGQIAKDMEDEIAAEKAMEETGWDVGKGSCFEEPMRAWSGGTTRLKSSLAVAAAALV